MSAKVRNVQFCSCCGNIESKEYEVKVTRYLVKDLARVVGWCLANGHNGGKREEFRHVMKEKSSPNNFHIWKKLGMCSGESSFYHFDLQKCQDFLDGKLAIHTQLWVKRFRADKELVEHVVDREGLMFVSEIPALEEFLTEYREYVVNYRKGQ